MALGKRREKQQDLLIPTTSLPRSPGHPFYTKLNELLGEAKFDRHVESLCKSLAVDTTTLEERLVGAFYALHGLAWSRLARWVAMIIVSFRLNDRVARNERLRSAGPQITPCSTAC